MRTALTGVHDVYVSALLQPSKLDFLLCCLVLMIKRRLTGVLPLAVASNPLLQWSARVSKELMLYMLKP